MEVSLLLSNLQQPVEEALDTVEKLGIRAIQFTASDEWSPLIWDSRRKTRFEEMLNLRGLKLSALGTGIGFDLGDDDKYREHKEILEKSLEMAADTGSGIFQLHAGVMPRSMSGQRWETFVRNFAEVCAHGEKVGACLALETGPEPPQVLERLIETVGSNALRINYDPANLILWPSIIPQNAKYAEESGSDSPYEYESAWRDFEPVEGISRVGKYIAQVHAKDAIVEKDGNGIEVPLGQGWVDWPRFVGLLAEANYDGYLTIERETGDDPKADIAMAATFLNTQISNVSLATR